jgi:putrescine aminotransferase
MQRRRLLELYTRHYNHTLGRLFDIAGCPVEASARGTRIFDEEGESYLDCAAGYGTFGVGHLHPRVQDAAQRQLARMAASPAGLYDEAVAMLLTRLRGLLPPSLSRVFLAGGGSEAVEIALRTVMWALPERKRLVAAQNSYHGKTLGALSVMGQPHLRSMFEPLCAAVEFVPYGDAEAMARAIGQGATAVFLESILGGGHLTVPPDGYLAAVRAACDRTGTPLAVDEVQTGFGRTGTMFAFEREGIVPDIVIMSKGVTGGHAGIGIAVMTEALAEAAGDAYEAGPDAPHAGMWNSALTCATACAAIDVIVDEDLPARAASAGARLIATLNDAVRDYPAFVHDVPGRGLMTGVRLRNNIIESAVWMQMLRRRVITGLSTNDHTAHPVLRFFPPLTIDDAEIALAADALRDSLRELARVPSLLYDLANKVFRLQHYLPLPLLRAGARLLSPPPAARHTL